MEDARTQLTVELPLPSRALCGNRVHHLHHAKRSRLVKAHRAWAVLAGKRALGAAGLPNDADHPLFTSGRVACRVAVTYDARWSARRLDDPNLQVGIKAYLDGLQGHVGTTTGAGVVDDDRRVFFDGPVAWTKVPVGCPTGLTLTLTPQEE